MPARTLKPAVRAFCESKARTMLSKTVTLLNLEFKGCIIISNPALLCLRTKTQSQASNLPCFTKGLKLPRLIYKLKTKNKRENLVKSLVKFMGLFVLCKYRV